jgi:hypothetical protein
MPHAVQHHMVNIFALAVSMGKLENLKLCVTPVRRQADSLAGMLIYVQTPLLA